MRFARSVVRGECVGTGSGGRELAGPFILEARNLRVRLGRSLGLNDER